MNSVKDKIIPIAPKPSLRMTIIAMLIVAMQVVVSVVTYPFLPYAIPSHWNASGQVDTYAPKLFLAILWPLVGAASYGFLLFVLSISPRLGSHRLEKTQAIAQLFLLATLLFLLIVQLTATAIALGFRIDITFIISLGISILFIFVGNYMGKLRRNFWTGIRTPWTIASDLVWERTHRFAGWLFVCVGLIGLIVSFVPLARFPGILVLIVLASIISAAYSYVVYKKVFF